MHDRQRSLRALGGSLGDEQTVALLRVRLIAQQAAALLERQRGQFRQRPPCVAR